MTNAWIDWFHIFIIRVNTNNIVMWEILLSNADLGLFQDSDFAGDLEDSKSTSGWTLCVFGSTTFVPISWMCKKQTSVSHSSTESEIISLDTGLMVILWQDCCGKGNLRKTYWNTVGRRFPTGNAYSYTVKKDYSYLRMWMTSNWLESNKILIRCGKYSIKKSIWENHHLFLFVCAWE